MHMFPLLLYMWYRDNRLDRDVSLQAMCTRLVSVAITCTLPYTVRTHHTYSHTYQHEYECMYVLVQVYVCTRTPDAHCIVIVEHSTFPILYHIPEQLTISISPVFCCLFVLFHKVL